MWYILKWSRAVPTLDRAQPILKNRDFVETRDLFLITISALVSNHQSWISIDERVSRIF